MTEALPEILKTYVTDAVVGTFAAGERTVAPFTPDGRLDTSDRLTAVMRLGFSDGSGSFVLSASRPLLAATHPLTPSSASETEMTDWLGEATNLIVGRFRQRLLTHGLAVQSGPPSVVDNADDLLEHYQQRGPMHMVHFRTKDGAAMMCLVSIPREDLPILAVLSMKPTVDMPKPGDAVNLKK